jgi:tetratricopeptide (TPR) repeat protein
LHRDYPQEESYQAQLAEDFEDLAQLYTQTGRNAEAGPTFAKAENLLRPLVDRHPTERRYALSLAALYVNWSYLLAITCRTPEALERLNRAVRLADASLQNEPLDPTARQRAFAAHGARAEVSEFAGRFADAVKDWDRVIDLEAGRARSRWRWTWARVLTLVGDHVRATAEAGELAAMPDAPADHLYFLARVYVMAIAPARADQRLPSAEREALAERYAARAVALLQKLLAQGYFKDPAHAKSLRSDTDLEPLRDREDFRKLVRERNRDPGG